jgi:hypothetical protein
MQSMNSGSAVQQAVSQAGNDSIPRVEESSGSTKSREKRETRLKIDGLSPQDYSQDEYWHQVWSMVE